MPKTSHARLPWLIGLVGITVGAWFAVSVSRPAIPAPRSTSSINPAPPVAAPQPPRFSSTAATPLPAPLAPSVNPPAPHETKAPRNSLRDLPADPFDAQGDRQPEVRTLAAVGDIQLGVLRNAKVRDEAGLKSALVRIGDEIERRIQKGPGGPGLQEILDSHREELGRYVDGEVELRGPDWMIGLEAGQPRPLHEDWHPRPN